MKKVAHDASVHPKTVTEASKQTKRRKRLPAQIKRQPVLRIQVDKRIWAKAMELAEGDATRIVDRKPDSVVVVNHSKRKGQ